MLKFILITLLAWFVISRLLRFKVVMFKGNPANEPVENRQRRYSPEGTLNVDKKPEKDKGSQSPQGGDYIDYEEV